ncbi:MAG: hypothetical protein AAGE93_08415 [Bacteroidota bacterium]
MMKNAVLVCLCALFLSCQDDVDCCTNIDVGVEFTVKSQAGVDLLDPASSDAFSEDDIWLYYLVDGETKRYHQSNLDAARGITVYQNSNQQSYVIDVFPNTAESEEFPVTYIQWNENDTDTLRCEFERTGNSTVCTRVWFNGELKRDPSIAERVFEVTK